MAGKWKLDERTGDELLCTQFSKAIASKSKGDVEISRRVVYPAFKPLFIEDSKYNPSLSNTHMSYEYESYHKEQTEHWKKVGMSFQKDPRFSKEDKSPRGPTKPAEFTGIFEKPQKVFGRTRKIRPFARAHPYMKPFDRSAPVGVFQLMTSLF